MLKKWCCLSPHSMGSPSSHRKYFFSIISYLYTFLVCHLKYRRIHSFSSKAAVWMGIYWKVIGIFKAAEHQPAVLYWTPWKISRMVERVNVFWMSKPCVIHECALIPNGYMYICNKSEMKQSSSDSQLIIKPEKVRHVNHKCHCSIHLPDWRTVKTLTYDPCIIQIDINGKAAHF